MDLKSIMTFDKRILKLDGMSIDEQVFADGAYRSGWLLGIDDETDQLSYFDPESGETITVNLKGDQVMRDNTAAGGSGVPPAQAQPPTAAPAAPAAPAAAPLPTLAALPTTPLPTTPVTVPPVTTPAAVPAAAPAAPELPSPGPTQIAVGIWQMPANAVKIAEGIYKIS